MRMSDWCPYSLVDSSAYNHDLRDQQTPGLSRLLVAVVQVKGPLLKPQNDSIPPRANG